MLSNLKKLVAGKPAGPAEPAAAPEHIFLLDAARKKEFLLDLRTILRTPGARDALPKLHKLESTITRNDKRFRIPHELMPSLVRELVSVESRIGEKSPLRELLDAVPGLARSIQVEPVPTSILMGSEPKAKAAAPTSETKQPAKPVAKTETKPVAKAPAAPIIPVPPAAVKSDAPGVLMVNTAEQAEAKAPVAAPGNAGMGATQNMSLLDQQRFLARSTASIQTKVLTTSELPDADLAAYFDLLLAGGEYKKIIDTLIDRVGPAPSAWAWTRLLAAAQGAGQIEYEVWCSTFITWVTKAHPQLLPDPKSEAQEELLYGVRLAALQELERRELQGKSAG